MSLFGSLYIGASGLQTGQNALNTTAHNVSNTQTLGYTRQQVALTDRGYNMIGFNPKAAANKQIGMGVDYAEVRQVRDSFLDQTYRKESGRSMFYEVSYHTLTEVESLLGELNDESFSKSIKNLWESVEELAKNPASSVTQGLLIQRCSQFVEQASNVYNALSEYQDNLNRQVKDYVKQVNDYADRIYELNKQIVRIECADVEHANDLRDERNYILDELGKLGNISYSEDQDGGVEVKFENHILVNRVQTFEIAIDTDSDTGFHTPYWKLDARKIGVVNGVMKYDTSNCKLYDMSQIISTERDTDVGGLKAVLLARGDHRANYTDLNDPKTYDEEISSSILMNVQAEFDNLIHNIVTQMNSVLEEAAIKDGGNYLRNEDNTILQLFHRISSDEYDSNGDLIREDLSVGSENTLFTIANLMVNPDLVKEPTRLGFTETTKKEDFAVATALQEVFERKDYTLNPNVTTKSNLVDYYSNMVNQVANAGMVFRSVYENEKTTASSTDNARQQVVGVADEEELSNMIRFQNAYNAASRYINVIDEMIEHILNTLGR